MIRQLARVRLSEYSLAPGYELPLPRSKARMQGKIEIEKSGRKVTLEVEVCRRGVDGKSVELFHAA